MNRFYHSDDIKINELIQLNELSSNHISRVLRMKEGDDLIIFNGDENDYIASIISLERKKVFVKIRELQKNHSQSSIDITLAQAITSREKLDFILQKTTELGVNKIQLMQSARCNFKIAKHKEDARISHWENVVIAASEQSGRTSLPTILNPVNFQEVLSLYKNKGNKIILDPYSNKNLKQLTIKKNIDFHEFIILIGPEGGFTPEEICIAKKHDFQPISLGKRILRTETASIAILSALHALHGDFV